MEVDIELEVKIYAQKQFYKSVFVIVLVWRLSYHWCLAM